ncbi:MAG: hypothetical protein ACKVTZ_12770 [Bacteroidia bacterium]
MTKQTELILHAAAKQVNLATTTLQKVMSELAKNVELIEGQNQQIAQNEAKIEELSTAYSEKAREAEVDFQLSLKENQKKTVQEVLSEQGFTSIKDEELADLRSDFAKLKSSFDTEVKKVESIAKNEANARIESLKNVMELEKRAEMAELNGKLSSALDKSNLLEEQLKSVREEIIAMRNAETERVKAISGKDVVINNGMQR